MLVIGSRAICYHFPQFRKPVDWDLIGNRGEQAQVAAQLPLDPKGTQSDKKTHYRYGDTFVEFAVREELPYWNRICEIFENEPTISDPVLGEMHVPPAPFLLLTKQAGLIYRIKHWHKNLEDLYYLQNLIPEIPEHIAPLLAEAQANSRDVYGEGHDRMAREPFACHPDMPPHPRPNVHGILHEALKFGNRPVALEEGAWQGFPQLSKEHRVEKMIRLFAEEAMVLAAHHYLEATSSRFRPCAEMKRFALRALITSCLPPAWRYFGVNHYPQISSLMPDNFYDRISNLESLRPHNDRECVIPDLAYNNFSFDE